MTDARLQSSRPIDDEVPFAAGTDAEAEAAETEAEAETEIESATAGPEDEPIVTIPRPEPGRQQRLFAAEVDEDTIAEAVEMVTSSGRASASQLQRRLRIDYEQAMELLAVLAARGVIELGEGESQGRVLVD